jgi:hypothetical protein
MPGDQTIPGSTHLLHRVQESLEVYHFGQLWITILHHHGLLFFLAQVQSEIAIKQLDKLQIKSEQMRRKRCKSEMAVTNLTQLPRFCLPRDG